MPPPVEGPPLPSENFFFSTGKMMMTREGNDETGASKVFRFPLRASVEAGGGGSTSGVTEDEGF